MNSLNILTRTRSSGIASLGLSNAPNEKDEADYEQVEGEGDEHQGRDGHEHTSVDEKTPMLDRKDSVKRPTWKIHRRIAQVVVNSIKFIIATITAPGRYLVACFYDEDGRFSSIMPLRRLVGRQRRKTAAPHTSSRAMSPAKQHRRQPSDSSIASTSSSMSGLDEDNDDHMAAHSRSHSLREPMRVSEGGEHRRSIRIQVQEEALRRRRGPRDSTKRFSGASPDDVATVASSLKSPSSPIVAANKTRYPRTPMPPRPLVPRRQPSYSLAFSGSALKKTLIIDLDETLIHSMAKGGRMSTGHMVEVRLGGPFTTSGVSIGAGVPILYFVHERPGCHEFLKKVCKWYELVIFTASVQEYADPVIDWVERERKYFSRRYYRQHCTYRNGAYIKDLAQVEPDLSKVMILDNSPMSYVFHEGKLSSRLLLVTATDTRQTMQFPSRAGFQTLLTASFYILYHY